MFGIPTPRPLYVACSECGAPVPADKADDHLCDRDRWLDYQMVKLGPALFNLERTIGAWLATPAGRFEMYYAERDRILGRVAPLHGDRAAVAA